MRAAAGIHNLHKEESPPEKECSLQGYIRVFVASRVKNHHDEGHFRKIHTLSFAFSRCKVAGFGGMGTECREIFTLIFI